VAEEYSAGHITVGY